MQAAMAQKKRYSRVEIATKLAQANDLVTRGKLQSEIARTLGVSVMTLHRWRKAPPGPQPCVRRNRRGRPGLQLEISRLGDCGWQCLKLEQEIHNLEQEIHPLL
jgi:transposase